MVVAAWRQLGGGSGGGGGRVGGVSGGGRAAAAAAVAVAARRQRQQRIGERTSGALKSALRTSTFKTSGKRVFVSNPSGRRIPISSGKQNNSNSDLILDGYCGHLISNLDALKPSRIKASHLKSKLGDSSPTIQTSSSPSRDRLVNNLSSLAPLKIVDGLHWSPGIYRALRLLGETLDAAWEGAFIRMLTL